MNRGQRWTVERMQPPSSCDDDTKKGDVLSIERGITTTATNNHHNKTERQTASTMAVFFSFSHVAVFFLQQVLGREMRVHA
jgi:hypothetical protein